MNSEKTRAVEGGRLDYVKAAFLLLPATMAFWFVAVFVFPKVKQICADAGYDARSFFQPVDVARANGIWLLFSAALVLLVLELYARWWPRCRRPALTTLVFLVNTAVLTALSGALVLMAMVAPALIAKR